MLYLMLPMYNEENAIIKLLDNVKKVVSELGDDLTVYVVDDGSNDQSLNNINEYQKTHPPFKLEVHSHTRNMGLGQAMRTGIYNLAKMVDDNDIVFTMDADNTHDPVYMVDLKRKIESGAELVVASRYCQGGKERGLKFHRKIFSRGASTLLGLVFRCTGIRDYTCGYRAYTGRLLKNSYTIYGDDLIRENGFTCMAELLIKVHPFAHHASEIPMELRYDLKDGASKMKIFKTIVRYSHLVTVVYLESERVKKRVTSDKKSSI